MRKRPPVGHYYPKFGVVEERPKTTGFSKLKRDLNSGVRQLTQETLAVPQAFED